MGHTLSVLPQYRKLVSEISSLYEGARKALVEAYWKIGQRIVQVEQQGAIKAAYGTGLLTKLSEDLTRECGPGFSPDNLQRMRRFYLTYPKNAASRKLTWSQYVELLPLGNASKRVRVESGADGARTRNLRIDSPEFPFLSKKGYVINC